MSKYWTASWNPIVGCQPKVWRIEFAPVKGVSC